MLCIEMAGRDDLPRVVELNLLSLEELKESLTYPIDEDEVRKSVYANWVQAPCFVLRGGKIKGFAGLKLSRSYFSKGPVLADYMFYILPEYRNIANIGALCKAARDFADSTGLPIVLDYIVQDDFKYKTRLLKRMGFKITGVTGAYNV